MRWTLVLMLLLCACTAQREAGQDVGNKASKPFPPKYYPPAIYTLKPLTANRPQLNAALERDAPPRYALSENTLASRAAMITKQGLPDTVYLSDKSGFDSLQRDLEVERLAGSALRKRLKATEAERDFWQEKNRQKFWTLIAMAVFGFLFILFSTLANRIKE